MADEGHGYVPQFTPIDPATHVPSDPVGPSSDRSTMFRLIYGNGSPSDKADLFWNGLLDAGLLCVFLIIMPWGALFLSQVMISMFDPLEEHIKGAVRARVTVIGYSLFILLIFFWPVGLCLNIAGLLGICVGWPLFLLAYIRPFDDQHYNDWRKNDGMSSQPHVEGV